MLRVLIMNAFSTILHFLFPISVPRRTSTSSSVGTPWKILFLWTVISLSGCEAYLNIGSGEPCIGTIYLNTNISNSLTLIRDNRWAFYTDNSNSQYHVAPSRSFSLIARDLCRIVFASSLWRSTCDSTKDEEANRRCLAMADVLHERSFIEPNKTIELWNNAFRFFNQSSSSTNLIKQSD